MVKKTIKKIEQKKEPEIEKDTPLEVQETRRNRGCAFCQSKLSPSYLDIANLRRYLSERSKILQKGYTKVCSKHQRGVAKNIKYARHLALLPFTPKV